MYNGELDVELVSMKYRMQDLIVNYFKRTNILDTLEYKFITDLDSLELLSFELNTQKEILKQLNKYYKENCKKCQFKILQTIKQIRSVTPNNLTHVRRKVANKKNIKYKMNKKSVSPINRNEKIDDISSILKDEDRNSFYSNSNNNLSPAQKKRNLFNKKRNINLQNNKINKNNIYRQGKNKYLNRKMTPDRNKNNKNYDRNSNLSRDKRNS